MERGGIRFLLLPLSLALTEEETALQEKERQRSSQPTVSWSVTHWKRTIARLEIGSQGSGAHPKMRWRKQWRVSQILTPTWRRVSMPMPCRCCLPEAVWSSSLCQSPALTRQPSCPAPSVPLYRQTGALSWSRRWREGVCESAIKTNEVGSS